MLNTFYDKFIFTNGLKFRHNNFFLINLPFLIMPVEILSSVLASEDADFHKKIYSIAKESVKSSLVKDMSLEFGFKGERMINFLRDYFSASGWGTIQIIDLKTEKADSIVMIQ